MPDRRLVVLVDDDPLARAGMERALRQRREWDLETRGTAEEALQLLRVADADVVVSDLEMPVMGGAEFLTFVRTLRPFTMRLVLTASPAQHEQLLATGVAHQFLTKPCPALALADEIQSLMRARERAMAMAGIAPPLRSVAAR
jgi:CheY-like chemotaxis protein